MEQTFLTTGWNGSGNTVWMVVTTNETGEWLHIDRFDSEAEALNWIKWS